MEQPKPIDSEHRRPQGTLCIEHTLLTHTPDSTRTFSRVEGLEERYLGEEAIEDKEHYRTIFPSVAPAIHAYAQDLLEENDKETLAIEVLVQRREALKQEQDEVGYELMAKAQEQGMASTEGVDTVLQLIGNTLREPAYAPDSLTHQFNNMYFNLKSWQIYPDKNGRAILVIPDTNTEVPLTQFSVADLDTLFEKDPEFVTKVVRSYYESSGKAHLLYELLYNLHLHQVAPEDIVSSFMDEISDSHTYKEDLANMHVLLTWLGSLGEDVNRYVQSFKEGVTYMKEPPRADVPDMASVHFYTWVKHMQTCPEESETMHQKAERLEVIHKAFSELRFQNLKQVIDQNIIPEESMRLLFYPLQYTEPMMQRAEARILADRTQYVELSLLLEDIMNVDDTERIVSIIESKHPRLHTVLTSFQEWIEKDNHYDTFDSVLERVTRQIQYQTATPSFYDIVRLWEKAIHSGGLNKKGTFEHISISHFGDISIYHRDLLVLLPLLSMKQAKLSLQRSDLKQDERKAITIQEAIQSAKNEYDAQVLHFDEALSEVMKMRSTMSEFLSLLDIPRELIDRLTELSDEGADEDFPEFVKRNELSFTVAFNALFLHKYHIIDISTPGLARVLQEVFPTLKPEMITTIQEYVKGKNGSGSSSK